MQRLLALCGLVGVLFAPGLSAQFERAAVLGTIRDASQAVVPAAEVTLTNIATGVEMRATSDQVGSYQFLNVAIGQYQVAAAASGFKTAVSDIFTVVVGARQRADLTLEVGRASEVIEVTGAAPLIETESSDRATVIGSKQAVELPLNGRSYADLTLLAPGTVQALRGSLSGRNASYHVNGLRSSYNNFTLDGVDNNSYGTSNQGFSSQVVQLSPDAVGEFKVVTNNFSAEYGRAGGAVINAAYRSGTNRYHLTAWEFLRNTDLNAVGFFKPANGKPNLVQNQYGISGGGPIVKNKAFFFGDFEGFRRRQSRLRFATLPTVEQKAGSIGAPIVDPYTQTPYGGGGDVVPQSIQLPFAQQVLGDLPNPNRGASVTGDIIGNNFESLPSERQDDDKGNIKGDFYANDRLTMFGRYSHRELNAFDPDEVPGFSGGDSNGNVFARNIAFVSGVTWTMSPTSLLEARVGITQSRGGKNAVNFERDHMTDLYGIPNIPRNDRIGGGLNAQEVNGFNDWGRQTSNPQLQNPDVVNPRVNYSNIWGQHTMKFGWEYQVVHTDINDLSPPYGRSEYNGRFSGASLSTPDGFDPNLYNLADFFVGAQSDAELSRFEILKYRQHMNFFYVQDDWKINPKLTLNLGLRYEYATPQWDKENRIGNFDPDTESLFFATDGSTFDRALVRPDRNNLGPRIGAAYQITPKTVLRGGYGVSYVHFNRMGGENILGFTGPFYFRTEWNQVPDAVDPSGLAPCNGPSDTFGTCFIRTQDGFLDGFIAPEQYSTATARVNYQPTDNNSGMVQSYHFTIQHQLAKDLALDVGYIGNFGSSQLILGDFNQARANNPGENVPLQLRRRFEDFTFIQAAIDDGKTWYNSLQVKLEKRYSDGVYLLNSFTWSKAIDNAPGHLETFNGDTSRVRLFGIENERGLSSYDVPVNNVTSLIWEIPFGRNRRFGGNVNPIVNGILGGWTTTLIHTARSGYPINVYYGAPSALQVCSGCRPRPNYLGGELVNDGRPIDNFFNESVLAEPQLGDPDAPFGNLGRNSARTHNFFQADLGLYKAFNLPRDGSEIEFRSEFFNLFNRTNFLAPGQNFAAGSFGRITGTFPARQIQFALKLYW